MQKGSIALLIFALLYILLAIAILQREDSGCRVAGWGMGDGKHQL